MKKQAKKENQGDSDSKKSDRKSGELEAHHREDSEWQALFDATLDIIALISPEKDPAKNGHCQ